MNNKVFLWVFLTLAISVISCENKSSLDPIELNKEKWRELNKSILASYAQDICLELEKDGIKNPKGHIFYQNPKKNLEYEFDNFIEELRFRDIGNHCDGNMKSLVPNLSNDENIAYFKSQFFNGEDYLDLLNLSECYKRSNKKYTDKSPVKFYLSNVLFTKDLNYGIMRISIYSTYASKTGVVVFKNIEGIYESYGKCLMQYAITP